MAGEGRAEPKPASSAERRPGPPAPPLRRAWTYACAADARRYYSPRAVTDLESIDTLAQDIRRVIIEQSKRANVGHIGSALSIADIIAALYSAVLPRSQSNTDRDRVVLSKGHAALALYAALELTGRLPAGTTEEYCGDRSPLGVHPEREVDGIDFCTGALGHGLSMAIGAALAARMAGSSRRSFVVMSDAELNEGSVWEAVMFAAHHNLSNIAVILDLNGQQALGYTRDVLDITPAAKPWCAFGWDTHEVDGHDAVALAATLQHLDFGVGAPHVIIARTTFGKGIRFMQSVIDWHYLPMTDEQYGEALAELEAART
jgi:transketolase